MINLNYMIMGFAVVFGALALHVASFVVRNNNLHRDLEMLEALDKKPPKNKAAKKKAAKRK